MLILVAILDQNVEDILGVGVAISSGASIAGATVLFVGGALVLSLGVGSAGAASSSLVAVVSTSCAVVVSPSLGRSIVCSVAGGGLVGGVARRSCSRASASRRNTI